MRLAAIHESRPPHRRYSSRTPLTTRSSYSELGVKRLTNVLGRHAEMFRARDNPGNALGQTMHRRSRCAIFREHMRSAPREALDPGQGMSCWAKHCADPAPDRHTVGAAEISPAQDSGLRY